MSIARRVTALHLLGTGAAALALCAASASGAWATGPGGDGWELRPAATSPAPARARRPGPTAASSPSTDRTSSTRSASTTRTSSPPTDGKVHVKVRTAGDASTCTASLASYLAHGATFGTSGEQVFVDFDTVTVMQGQTDSLDIAVPDAGCFAQIDLYRGKVKFDGDLDAKDGFEHGDVPKGPDRPVIKDKLIAAWNGGTKDCATTPPPAEETPGTPTPTPPPPAEETPGTPTPSVPVSETTPPVTETPAHPDAARRVDPGVHAAGHADHPGQHPAPAGRDRRRQRHRPDRGRRRCAADRRRGDRGGDEATQDRSRRLVITRTRTCTCS